MGPKSNFNQLKKLVQGNDYFILKLINLTVETVRLLSDNTCSKREGVVLPILWYLSELNINCLIPRQQAFKQHDLHSSFAVFE